MKGTKEFLEKQLSEAMEAARALGMDEFDIEQIKHEFMREMGLDKETRIDHREYTCQACKRQCMAPSSSESWRTKICRNCRSEMKRKGAVICVVCRKKRSPRSRRKGAEKICTPCYLEREGKPKPKKKTGRPKGSTINSWPGAHVRPDTDEEIEARIKVYKLAVERQEPIEYILPGMLNQKEGDP